MQQQTNPSDLSDEHRKWLAGMDLTWPRYMFLGHVHRRQLPSLLENLCHGTNIVIDRTIFLLLALEPSVMGSLQDAAKESIVSEVRIDLCLPAKLPMNAQPAEDWQWDPVIPATVCRTTAMAIGKLLRMLTMLSKLDVDDGRLNVAATILGACWRVKTLRFAYGEVRAIEPLALLSLSESMMVHKRMLQHFSLVTSNHGVFHALCLMLRDLPNLTNLSLQGYGFNDLYQIWFLKDAKALADVLKMKSLWSVNLDNIRFTSDHSVDAFVGALNKLL